MGTLGQRRNSCLSITGLVWPVFCLTMPCASMGHPGLHHDIERVSKSIEDQPGNAELYVQRGHYLRLDGQPLEALADFDRARHLQPDLRDIAAHRGIALAELGRDDEAIGELSAFLDSGPGSATAYAERAKIRVRRGELSRAVADYLSAIALVPDVELYIACGKLQTDLGWLPEASVLYREGLSAVGEAEVLIERLVQIETRLGRFADAIALVDRHISNGAAKSIWLTRRAEIWEQSGNVPAAEQDRQSALGFADQAVVRRPDAINLVARAEVFVALGRFQEAREDLLVAVKKSPRFKKANELLAKIESETDSRKVQVP